MVIGIQLQVWSCYTILNISWAVNFIPFIKYVVLFKHYLLHLFVNEHSNYTAYISSLLNDIDILAILKFKETTFWTVFHYY